MPMAGTSPMSRVRYHYMWDKRYNQESNLPKMAYGTSRSPYNKVYARAEPVYTTSSGRKLSFFLFFCFFVFFVFLFFWFFGFLFFFVFCFFLFFGPSFCRFEKKTDGNIKKKKEKNKKTKKQKKRNQKKCRRRRKARSSRPLRPW
jgi:hypothetical protein